MDGRARTDLIERRLRALVSLCGALLGGAWLCAALVLVLIVRANGELYVDRPDTFPFLLALGAMIAVLLSSAARTAILRRALEKEEDARAAEEEELAPRDPSDAQLAQRLAAYVRATRVSFGMQAAAAAGGLTAALVGGVPLYGLMVCATSALAMSARWPRRVVVEHFVESGLPAERRRGR